MEIENKNNNTNEESKEKDSSNSKEKDEKSREYDYYNMRIHSQYGVDYSYMSLDLNDLFTNLKYLDFYKNKDFYLDVKYRDEVSDLILIRSDIKAALDKAMESIGINVKNDK